MKVLIVAKTRRATGACIGGITEKGGSVRLIAHDAGTNVHAGLEYNIGEVWEIEAVPDPDILLPHTENLIVLSAKRLRQSCKLVETVYRFMPPIRGGPEVLFEGLLQATASGGLFVTERTGLPAHSTLFWLPDQSLRIDVEGKRIRYRYPMPDGGRTLTFVGFQEPLSEIPAGTLLRVSLAHRWRPKDRPEEELRCFAQLSGWFMKGPTALSSTGVIGTAAVEPPAAADTFVDPHSETAADALIARARETLKSTFGFSSFLPVQAEVMKRVLLGRDTLVVMPTGGGKSLCYQLPALLWQGLTVVISPLIALMQDQVRQLREVRIPAACLNHMVPLSEWIAIAHRVRDGEIRILYLAPETLQKPETLLLIESSNLACLAIDEAHCISEWGHDFRPDYRQLRELRRRFSQAVCLALTATATSRVRADIRALLGIPAEDEFVASFNRKNLHLAVEARHDALAQILAFLENRRGQSGIVYCGTRKQVDELCDALNANGCPALPYHAGLDDELRRRNQERFIQEDDALMVATVAFGMGINKSNVRFVIHAHLPKDLESYYQEIGRAGRDGLPAECLLLYSRRDAMVHRHFIDQGAPSERPGRLARLEALMRFAEVHECRRAPLLAYFGETFTPPCGGCDNCLRAPVSEKSIDVTAAAQKFLSCARLTGELFGPAQLIAVLRGSKSAKVTERGHDRLPLYGTGQEHSAEQWRELAGKFLQLGLMEQDFQYGSLRLTPKGRAVLHDNERVLVQLELSPAPSTANAGPGAHDPELFERLRLLRRQLAAEAYAPSYVIFSDRALIEMATQRPVTPAQFLAINGVGQAKLEKYGGAFLELIRDYCADNPKSEGVGAQQLPAKPIIRPGRRRRFQEVGELFAAGVSIADIARRYDVVKGTILHHLHTYVESGERLDPARLLAQSSLSQTDQAAVFGAFEQLGFDRLGPVHEALAAKFSYEELHLLRLYLRISERK